MVIFAVAVASALFGTSSQTDNKLITRLKMAFSHNTLLPVEISLPIKSWFKILGQSESAPFETPRNQNALIDGEGRAQTAIPKQFRLEPHNFTDMIALAAARYQLDPNLIRAVIKVESNYDPQAVSKAGAMGLMQLMPETAAEMGVIDPFDPQENVLGGARYLRQMLDRYSGDLELALAAYNWGPGNLDRSSVQPPAETAEYVRRIFDYSRAYSKAT